MAKNGAEVERYLRSVQGQEGVRLLFRLRTGSAGLLKDKKRSKIIIDEGCVICESGEEKMWSINCDMWGIEMDRCVLADEVSRIVGAGVCLEEYGRLCKEGKVELLLGKGVEGVSGTVMGEVDECVMY